MFSAEGYSAPRDPLVGQVVGGRYQIVHAIGKGSMGVVYEAQHLFIGRKVALKTMATHAASPACVQRFRREAQAAAAVGSSHVIDVLDMGQLENGSLYIVMEHLNGVDLGFAVALEQRFPVARAVHVLCQLCDALSAIHGAGIVHRDLKPENIFLTTRDGAQDFVKVLDFGVCKFNEAGAGRLTATGDTVGTPLFMAPEQVEGRTDCDFRADIYALGAILYFALTGRAPFDAPNLPSLFLRICQEPAPSLRKADSSLSSGLDAIVQRALSKDPNARFHSCNDFKAALLALQGTSDEMAATLPCAAPDSSWGERAWGNGTTSLLSSRKLRGRRRMGVAAAAAGGLLVSVALGTYARGHRSEAEPPIPAEIAHNHVEVGSILASEGRVNATVVTPVDSVEGPARPVPDEEPRFAAVLRPRVLNAPRPKLSLVASLAASLPAPSSTTLLSATAGAPSVAESAAPAVSASATPAGGALGTVSAITSQDEVLHLTKGPKREP